MISAQAPFLRSPPLGARMPDSVHAVTCSIPTMDDVIGYEEKRPETMAAIASGYPRFVTHFYLRRVEEDWKQRFALGSRRFFFTASGRAAADLLAYAADPDGSMIETDGVCGVHFAAESPGTLRARTFLQHTGCGISSRLAEDYLLSRGLLSKRQPEERFAEREAQEEVAVTLARAFVAEKEDVHLASSGMNAFYAIFRALHTERGRSGRRLWIQLGWLYVDTIEIMRKLGGPEGEHLVWSDVFDLDGLEKLLAERGGEVAGIVTEIPTNPLIQTTDLPRLRQLSLAHEIPLILDPTLATPLNIDILRYCDAAVNSLTKYTGSAGDVMMGAAIVNRESRWHPLLRERLPEYLTQPYPGDVARLAFEMGDYPEVVARINANTVKLVAFLEKHPSVERVYWSYAADSRSNYERLARRPAGPGGVFSLKLRVPLASFYDRVRLPKGPSFGTTFTLMCPFLYLAHYDLVSTPEGRETLCNHKLDADLLRVSVGIEDVDQIIAAFAAAL